MEEKRAVDEMLEMLATAPDSQIDGIITSKLKDLVGKPIHEIKLGVMESIDLCIYGSLSSGIALQALHLLHEVHCGGKHEDFTDENCPWRKEIDDD
jgi:hypothetical protein